MPIHEYKCGKCGHVFELFIFGEVKDDGRICPKCSEPGAKKVISSFSSISGGVCEGGCGTNRRGFS